MSDIRFRRMLEEDRDFIVHSWVESFRYSGDVGPIHVRHQWDAYSNTVDEILDDEHTEVWVALNPKDDDDRSNLYGYICVGGGRALPVLHFVYVKTVFRRMNVAKRLLNVCNLDIADPFLYTFPTDAGMKILKTKTNWPAKRIEKNYRPEIAQKPWKGKIQDENRVRPVRKSRKNAARGVRGHRVNPERAPKKVSGSGGEPHTARDSDHAQAQGVDVLRAV